MIKHGQDATLSKFAMTSANTNKISSQTLIDFKTDIHNHSVLFYGSISRVAVKWNGTCCLLFNAHYLISLHRGGRMMYCSLESCLEDAYDCQHSQRISHDKCNGEGYANNCGDINGGHMAGCKVTQNI